MLWYFAVVAYLLAGLPVARRAVLNNNDPSSKLDYRDTWVFIGAELFWPFVALWWFFFSDDSIILRGISKLTGVPTKEK